MWKYLLHTTRFTYLDLIFLGIAGSAIRADDWWGFAFITCVWFTVVTIVENYYDKKKV